MHPLINLDGCVGAVRLAVMERTAPVSELVGGLNRLFARLRLPIRVLEGETPGDAVRRCHAYLDCLEREEARARRLRADPRLVPQYERLKGVC